MIPITVKADKIGMEMSMMQYGYFNTKNFPEEVLITIDGENYVMIFSLHPGGSVSIEKAPVESQESPQTIC